MISRYHAQLVSIMAKLPLDVRITSTNQSKLMGQQIRLPFTYMSAFDPSAAPISLNNLVFERAALLFNLSALYSQLAATEDRLSIAGIKRAASSYQVYYLFPLWLIHLQYSQHAAGTLSFLYYSVLPEFVESCHADERPIELSKDLVKGLECLMLAQAQECSWQLAKLSMLKLFFSYFVFIHLGQYRNTLIAKIAAGVISVPFLLVLSYRMPL